MDLFSDGDIPGRQFHKEMELLPGIPRDFYEVFWGSFMVFGHELLLLPNLLRLFTWTIR